MQQPMQARPTAIVSHFAATAQQGSGIPISSQPASMPARAPAEVPTQTTPAAHPDASPAAPPATSAGPA
eukprot:4534880-Alexandrium_andersonii.AAC.1